MRNRYVFLKCVGKKLHGARILLALVACVGLMAAPASAQTAGEGAITGTVTDATGAVIPNATVTARNVATGVETSRKASSAGVYQISPLIVGDYSVTVTVAGFQTFQQDKIEINQNQIFGLNVALKIGNQSTTVTVTEAPPALDTANASLGSNISSKEFMDLPLMVAGLQQRDVTSFSNLLPGAQPGSRSSLFSGTANRVQEVYLDGIPLSTISQIGDNRPIFNVVPLEGIGQIGALTSGQSVEYQGAGSVNYSMKSGGNQYHGTVADFVRNTIFDTWGFTAGYATKQALVNGVIKSVPAGKPADHQNEFTAAVGGPVVIPHLFNGHDKMFFFVSYDKVHSRSAPNLSAATVPTTLMQQGDFTELLNAKQSAGTGAGSQNGPGYLIYDPTTNTCAGSSCTRKPFTGMKNGLPTPNIIPAGEISPIAQKMQSYLPTPTTSGIQNNYLGGIPGGYDNWLYSGRLDYTVSPKQTIAFTLTGGNRHAVPYTGTSRNLPLPYLGTTFSTVAGHWADLSDSYSFTQNLVNQFKFGFMNFGGPPVRNITEGTQYAATLMGINFTGVPSNGQAVTEFPTNSFGGSNAPSEWGEGGSGVTSTTVTNAFTLVDNLLWIKGKHAMTFGIQVQRLEDQSSRYDGPTSSLTLNWGTNETAQETTPPGKAPAYVSSTGYSYASYLLGAVGSTGITLQPFSVLGGRYRPFAPYFQDDWKITPKLTLNLGLRWDYIPTYQEAQSRFSFLNPNIANPVTGNLGALQFAGNHGGSAVSCGCSSPAHNYMKNWGPRVGFAYAVNDKTVVRGAFATVYSHGGGTGGAGSAGTGPSQLGFTSSPSFPDGVAGPTAGPAFYLNTSSYFNGISQSNANFGGPGYSVPAITPPGAISQTLNVGNTVDGAGNFIQASGAPGFADPYLSGRTPEFNFWNLGVQRQLTNNLTITVNYAGTESHFLAGASNMRGLYAGQINPIYWALGTLLSAPATPANVAAANVIAAQAGIPQLPVAGPYPGFQAAAATSKGRGKATILQSLEWMPQFSGTSDTWGSQGANSSYHSLQVSLAKRISNGLTFNLNYTYSKNIDDAGSQRSGWAIPANRIATGKAWKQNRIDRALSGNNVPQNLSIYGVYHLPFGKGHIGSNSLLVRTLAGGWAFSGVFTYRAGGPLAVTASSCNSSYQPTAGTCMPDINPSYAGKTIRQNGSWGKGTTATTLGKIVYANGYIGNSTLGDGSDAGGNATPCGSAVTAFCNPGQFMFGDAPRTAAYNLRGPGTYNMNASLRRTFNITPERVKFVFAVDCQNVTNKVTFGKINTNADSAGFGTVGSATGSGGSRSFQFSGRINF
jgi:hypothetical protein